MNYFFKYLIPQLLEYFNYDVDSIKESISETILKLYKSELLKTIKDNGKDVKNETTN